MKTNTISREEARLALNYLTAKKIESCLLENRVLVNREDCLSILGEK